MTQVICTSKAAKLSAQIGGVKFFSSDAGRISEEISEERAAEFLKTPTYFRLHEGDPIEAPEPKKAAKPARAPAAAPKGTSQEGAGGSEQPSF